MIKKPTVIIIAGPTASGKTDLAVQIAKRWNTEILSADSRQCFKEMSIGVAKPTAAEMDGIKHYFIDSHSIQDDVNAGTFERYGLEKLALIFQKSPIAVVVGGTGLYIKALCEGMDNIPAVPAALRQSIIDEYETKGLEWLQQEIQKADIEFWQKAEQQNPQRLMRALEVKRQTGKSILHFQKNKKAERPFNTLKFCIDWDRQALYERINRRVDNMLKNGLVAEVKSLLPYEQLNALQTVGYKEIFEYLHGHCNLETATEEIKKNTRHYAKRQITWFKKDLANQWYSIDTIENAIHSAIQAL